MTVLIFGATGGIGSTLARRLSNEGRSIHLSGRDHERLRSLGEELSCPTTQADVIAEGAIENVVQSVGDEIAGLVFAPGSITLKPLSRTTDAEILHDFSLNALAAARAVRAALPSLKRAGNAAIVLFSTIAVARGFAFHSSIAMAKGAVEGLTRSLAAELAPKIRVNCIAPSLTRTPLTAGLIASEQAEAGFSRAHPLQRIGEADDIAAMAEFLLSSRAAWVTGQVLAVDGGRSTLSGPA